MSHSVSLRACLTVIAAIFALISATGCGGGSMVQQLNGNTQVTVAVTGTGNDQLSEFNMVLNTVTLMSTSGKTANLITAPQGFEFVHIDGQLAPAFTITVPQDIYISGTATVGTATFECANYVPDFGLTTATYQYGYTPNSNVTVNLTSPITITGSNMGLLIDLQVSQSAMLPSNCWDNGASWSITPTFDVTPAVFSPQPTNPNNGKVAALDGEISAIAPSGDSFTLAVAEGDGPQEQVVVSAGNNTVYQGIAGFNGLTVGTFVDMDGALQPDSSVLASRIAVEYASTLNVAAGPLIFVDAAEPALADWAGDQEGIDYADAYFIGAQLFSFDSAVFQISGQLTNLQSLPFVPSFTGSNMVAGQNLYLSSPRLSDGSNPYTELDAVTLIPQSINGSVTASTLSGSFTDYSVSLAPYDLFPNLAVQPGQTILLNNPSDVEVYVDGNTQLLNSQPLGVGGTFRFYGLVFNDNGTLRMDCAQVNDGVSEAQSSGTQRGQLQPSTARVTRRSVGHGQSMRNAIVRQMER